ncbi:MFS transporter [Brevibacillus migulae]|uniref:MFS transporter n=1 Tax=Brevibacillus migulae TaxID=1644114 RepID=UPI00106E1773|nr:MFS transporter [Brevibacillus migulae]
MSKIQLYWKAYHPVVHMLMLGSVLITLTSSMSLPFLAIYWRETTEMDYASIGVIIGAGAIAATVSGFIGGILSDLFGRTKLMIVSLLVLAICFAGFVWTTHPALLFLLSIGKGISSAFFATISKTLMGDLTPEDKRYRMFANRYLAINIGFSAGPMAGAFLGIGGSPVGFQLTALVYMLYAIVLGLVFLRITVQSDQAHAQDKVTFRSALQVVRHDRVLLLLLLGSICLMTVHGQMSVTLSQYLKDHFVDGVKLFAFLMSLNGLTVIFAQIPVTRWAERFTLFGRIVLGCLLFTAGEVGFAFSEGWLTFSLSMILFTIGEILVVPAEFAQLDQITPEGMRGTYYGAQGFSEFGNFLGPWLGGLLLAVYGGEALFLTMGAISLISLVFFSQGRIQFKRRESSLSLTKDS